MEKSFWVSIKEDQFVIPDGYSADTLTDALFSYVGSTDSELRDTIGLQIFWNWMQNDVLGTSYIRELIPRLLSNLAQGLGENGTDSVFLRSFSLLWLACIVDYDNKNQILSGKEVDLILERTIKYASLEKDTRGLVESKGWAHAVAHLSDLLMVLVRNRNIDSDDQIRIINWIARKLNSPTDEVFIYGEDRRLSRILLEVLKRGEIGLKGISAWLKDFSSSWTGAWQTQARATAFLNARNFIYCVKWQLESLQDNPDHHVIDLLKDALNNAKPWEMNTS